MLDYNTDFKTPAQVASASTRPTSSASPTTTRCSSGLSLNDAPTGCGRALLRFRGRHGRGHGDRQRPERRPADLRWDLDDNGSFETPGQSATFDASIATPGPHTIKVRATDTGDLSAVDTATVTVTVTYDSLCALTKSLVTKKGVEDELCKKLEQAEKAAAKGKTKDHDKKLEEYRKKLDQETGKAVSATSAARLKSLSLYL